MNPAANGFLLSLSLCLDIGIVNVAMMTLAMQRSYWSGFWLGLGSCVGDLTDRVVFSHGLGLTSPKHWKTSYMRYARN